MKTLIKLAASAPRGATWLHGVLFDGNIARATDGEIHATTTGEWFFDVPTLIPLDRLKPAMALSKRPAWSGDTLNGVKLTGSGEAADFPAMPDMGALAAMITIDPSRALPAMAKQEVRYCLNGLYLDLTAGAVVATDGHRLHMIKDAFPPVPATPGVIIRREAFDLVKAGPVTIDVHASHCAIHHPTGAIVAAHIDGRFPDYRKVTPETADRPIAIPFGTPQIAALAQACQALKAAGVKWPAVAIQSDGSLALLDGMTLPCFEIGPDEPFGVHAGYLHEALKAAGTGVMRLDGPNDSALVRGATGDFTAVVMPCRI